ncbi:cryptochrome [Sarotherodon galilaeus]
MLFPDVHSAASLTVSPDRVQHFTSDSVSLTCEGNFTEWRVRKFSEDGRLSDCRRMTGSTCNINTSKSDTGVYWCESGSGEFSSAVNITVQNDGNGPILVSPVHPVTEGASVSLSCSLRTQKILSNVFLYHNDKLIQNDTRGELKISAVSKSDEGFYKCQYSGTESAQSWMSVKVTGPSSSPVWLMVGLVCGVSLIIILLLLLYRCRQSKYSCFTRSIQSESHSPGSSTNHGVNQNETHVYDSPHYGTNNLYESVSQVEDNRNGSDEHQDVTYALTEFKNFGKKRKHHKPEQSAVYSEVKTGAAELEDFVLGYCFLIWTFRDRMERSTDYPSPHLNTISEISDSTESLDCGRQLEYSERGHADPGKTQSGPSCCEEIVPTAHCCHLLYCTLLLQDQNAASQWRLLRIMDLINWSLNAIDTLFSTRSLGLGEPEYPGGTFPAGYTMDGWQTWIVCLVGLSIEDAEDIYLFGTMITGFLLIGAGLALAYRRIKKAEPAVQTPPRLPARIETMGRGATSQNGLIECSMNRLFEHKKDKTTERKFDNIMEKLAALQREIERPVSEC